RPRAGADVFLWARKVGSVADGIVAAQGGVVVVPAAQVGVEVDVAVAGGGAAPGHPARGGVAGGGGAGVGGDAEAPVGGGGGVGPAVVGAVPVDDGRVGLDGRGHPEGEGARQHSEQNSSHRSTPRSRRLRGNTRKGVAGDGGGRPGERGCRRSSSLSVEWTRQ